MPLYANTNDVNLLRDIMLQSGKLYARKFEFVGKGTVGTPGAAAVITLTGATFANDEYNGYQLNIVDDASLMATVDIDDSIADTSITVDTTASIQVLDESTVGGFTAATEYDLYILGDEKFFGYSDQNVDIEENTVSFKTGNIPEEEIREDTVSIVQGYSGTLRSFGADTQAEIFALTAYGSQTNQNQYHGGNEPAVRPFWALSLRMDNVLGQAYEIAAFKAQFFPNGPVNTSEAEYKNIPYRTKWFIDTLRDSGKVNKWKIKQATA